MTAAHAPPWRAADKAAWFRGQRHPDDGKIAIHPVGRPGTVANAYGRENARLIAAAPDLLEALILLEREMVLSGNAESRDYGWLPAITKTRAAILKATTAAADTQVGIAVGDEPKTLPANGDSQ